MVLLAASVWLATVVVVLATSTFAAEWHRTTRAACALALFGIVAAVGLYAMQPEYGSEPVAHVALGTLLGTIALGASLFSRHTALIERLQPRRDREPNRARM